MVVLPDNILRWMSAEDRKHYAKGQLTAQEAIAKCGAREEGELHKLYESWLNLHDFDFCHARMDRPTTIKKGISDFHVWRSLRHCFIEFKADHGVLSKEQVRFINRQLAQGTPVLITTSFVEACDFTLMSLSETTQDESWGPILTLDPSEP
jgi:hypothetical protein